MNEGANHLRLEMLVGRLLVDGLYLSTKVVANILAMVIMVLQEVVVVVFQEVAIVALQEVVVANPKETKIQDHML
jgi:hypothetical protein